MIDKQRKYQRKMDRLYEMSHNMFRQFPGGKSYSEYTCQFHKLSQQIIKNQALLIVNTTKFEIIGSVNNTNGDYIPMDSFYGYCEDGGFIDDDGFGELCVGEGITNMGITPSVALSIGLENLKQFGGVMWYNR